jgi:hypothetical protein
MQAPYRLRQSAACASCPGNSAGRQKLDLPSFRATVCNQVLAVHFLRAMPKSVRSGSRERAGRGAGRLPASHPDPRRSKRLGNCALFLPPVSQELPISRRTLIPRALRVPISGETFLPRALALPRAAFGAS